MLLPILTMPHPLLSQKSRAVRPDELGRELATRLADMAETMYAAPGVGLAAVQVGDLRRMVVADLPPPDDEDDEADGEGESGRRRRPGELVHLVNPTIVERSPEMICWEEGCLSVPDFWEDVERHRVVRVRFQDAHGEVHERTFQDFHAVIVQHELDHLEGVVLLDRTSRLKRTRYLKRAKKEPAEEAGIR